MSNFPYPLLHMLHRASPVANSNDGVPRSQMASATAVVGRCLRLLLVDVCEKRSARIPYGIPRCRFIMVDHTVYHRFSQGYSGVRTPHALSASFESCLSVAMAPRCCSATLKCIRQCLGPATNFNKFELQKISKAIMKLLCVF